MPRVLPWMFLAILAAAACLGLGVFRSDDADDSEAGISEEGNAERVAPTLTGTGAEGEPLAVVEGPGRFRVDGRVEDEAGKGLPSVRVGIRKTSSATWDPQDMTTWGSRPEEAFQKALAEFDEASAKDEAPDSESTTAADGSFVFTPSTPGAYEIRAVPDDPAASSRQTVHLSSRQAATRVTLQVRSGTALQGRVEDATGAGVAATIVATATLQKLWTFGAGPVPTGEGGAFTLAPLPAGAWMLEVRVPGRITLKGVKVEMPRSEPLVIRIDADGGSIAGRVTDLQQRPVEGASVLVSVGGGIAKIPGATVRGTSGADGSYRIAGVPEGKVTYVQAHAEGYAVAISSPPLATWSGQAVVGKGEARVDVVLERGAVVEGRVLEHGTGKGIADAEVIVAVPWRSGGGRPLVSRSGKDGSFRIAGVAPGRSALLARSRGHYMKAIVAGSSNPQMISGPDGRPLGLAPPEIVLVVGTDGATIHRDVLLHPGLVVTGRVIDPVGNPVAGAAIQGKGIGIGRQAWQWGINWQGGSTDRVATSGPDGAFEVASLPPSEETVLFAGKAPWVGQPCEPFALAVGAPAPDVTLRLAAGAVLTGRVVTAEGEGIAGAMINVWGQWGDVHSNSTSTVTDFSGAFRIEGLPPGDANLGTNLRDGQNVNTPVAGLKPGEVREGIEVKVEPGARVAGTLVDQDGKPLSGKSLNLHSTQGGSWQHTSTEEDGSFEFLAAPKGNVNIQLQDSNNYQMLAQNVASPTDNLRLTWKERATTVLEGTVVDPRGSPVPLCVVSARSGKGQGRERNYPGGQEPGEFANGRFRLTVQGDPPYQVSVTAPRDDRGQYLNLLPKTESVTDASRPVEIRLEEGLTVSGRVYGPDDAGLSGVTVQVGPSAARTDDDGTFRVGGLADGEVSVSVFPPRGMVAPNPEKVRVGTRDLRLQVVAGAPISGTVVDQEGQPVNSGYVTAQLQGSGNTRQLNAQVEMGRFRIEGLAPGAMVTLTIQFWGMSGQSAAPITVKDVRAGTLDLVVRQEPGVAVDGRVYDSDGKPFSKAWINAQLVGETQGGWAHAQISEDGTFRLQGLKRAEYRIMLQRHDNGPMPEPLKVTPPASGLRFDIPRSEQISGRLVSSGDLTGFQVSAYAEGNPDTRWISAVALADGSFTLEGVGGGSHTLAARKDGDDRYAFVTPVQPGTKGLSVPLVQGLSIDGTVESTSASKTQTWVMATGGGWRTWARPKEDGSFSIRGLPPGNYMLNAQTFDGTDSVKEENVAAGSTGVRMRLK